jgi:integrase
MRKTGCPWYRQGTDSWYVWHEGRQVLLAKGRESKAEAYARFAALLGAAPATEPRPALTIQGLVEAFKTHRKDRIKPATLKSYAAVLDPLKKQMAERLAAEVNATDLEDWARQQDWSTTTQRFALAVAITMFRWSEQSGLLSTNPIVKLHKPPARSRGTEALIDAELHRQLLGVVSPVFGDFIEAVHATGARPGEIARIEAQHIVWDASCIVLLEHKTEKTGRVRTIYLPPLILDMCRRLAAKHPVGPIFRNTRGEPWKKTGWKQAMERAQRKLNLPMRPLTSGYRHTFATDALEQGVPDAHVAELLGHASTTMIHRHYGHLAAKAKVLRASLDRVRGRRD